MVRVQYIVGFMHRLGQFKDNKIGICCFSAKRTAFRKKSKDWLSRMVSVERNN